MTEPLLLKAEEVAKLLRIGRSKVFAMLAAGELPVVRLGRSVRVPRAALEGWIEERTQAAPHQDEAEPFSPPKRIHVADVSPHNRAQAP